MNNIQLGDTVEIRTIKDIADLTPEQFEAFHIDLKNWHGFNTDTKAAAKEAKKIFGDALEINYDDTKITWTFDKKTHANIRFQAQYENGDKIEGLEDETATIEFKKEASN